MVFTSNSKLVRHERSKFYMENVLRKMMTDKSNA